MAILLVDDDSGTRELIRGLLEARIDKLPVLEARDGEEALKVIDKERGRLRLILSDWDMPRLDGLSLLREFQKRDWNALTTFLLITSSQPDTIDPRLDGLLAKPFRGQTLFKAISDAFRRRVHSRDAIAFLGPVSEHEAFKNAVAAGGDFHWRMPIVAAESQVLAKAIESLGFRLGALVVDPRCTEAAEWLGQLKKNQQGHCLVYAATSRRAEEIQPFRTFCEVFLARPETAAQWSEALTQIARRTDTRWDFELLVQTAKAALAADQKKALKETAQQMLKLDPGSADAHYWMGRAYETLGKPAPAIEHFLQSVERNPCSPRGYARLFGALPPDELGELSRQAVAYCPKSVEILELVADWREQSGDADGARALRDQAQGIAPGARETRKPC